MGRVRAAGPGARPRRCAGGCGLSSSLAPRRSLPVASAVTWVMCWSLKELIAPEPVQKQPVVAWGRAGSGGEEGAVSTGQPGPVGGAGCPPHPRDGAGAVGGRGGQRRRAPVPAAEVPLPFGRGEKGRRGGGGSSCWRALPPRTFPQRAHACLRPTVGRVSAPHAAAAGAKPTRKNNLCNLLSLLRRVCACVRPAPGPGVPGGEGWGTRGWGGFASARAAGPRRGRAAGPPATAGRASWPPGTASG